MKNKLVVLILILLNSSFAMANEQQVSSKENPSHVVKFSVFDPDNKYSFKVYARGDIVSYDGKLYEAKRAVNNNAAPKIGDFWKLLTNDIKVYIHLYHMLQID